MWNTLQKILAREEKATIEILLQVYDFMDNFCVKQSVKCRTTSSALHVSMVAFSLSYHSLSPHPLPPPQTPHLFVTKACTLLMLFLSSAPYMQVPHSLAECPMSSVFHRHPRFNMCVYFTHSLLQRNGN